MGSNTSKICGGTQPAVDYELPPVNRQIQTSIPTLGRPTSGAENPQFVGLTKRPRHTSLRVGERQRTLGMFREPGFDANQAAQGTIGGVKSTTGDEVDAPPPSSPGFDSLIESNPDHPSLTASKIERQYRSGFDKQQSTALFTQRVDGEFVVEVNPRHVPALAAMFKKSLSGWGSKDLAGGSRSEDASLKTTNVKRARLDATSRIVDLVVESCNVAKTLVTFDAEQPTGFACYEKRENSSTPTTLEIQGLVTHPACRGTSQLLMEEIVNRSVSSGCAGRACLNPMNSHAMQVFESMGFRPVDGTTLLALDPTASDAWTQDDEGNWELIASQKPESDENQRAKEDMLCVPSLHGGMV